MSKLTEAQLREIRERAEKATPGPWDNHIGPRFVHSRATGLKSSWICQPQNEGDVPFIAHARTDVPALLDEVERLRGALGFVRRQDRTRGYPTGSEWADIVQVAVAALEGK